MKLWRFALTKYLATALKLHLIHGEWAKSDPHKTLQTQASRWWNIHISRFQSKGHFLQYAGRYARRLPVSERHLVAANRDTVTFWAKDHRQRRRDLTSYSRERFMGFLQLHVPDRYCHAIRYYGLWGPRIKSQSQGSIFVALGQTQRTKPSRLRWAASIKKHFGRDPLLGKDGLPLRWSHRLAGG